MRTRLTSSIGETDLNPTVVLELHVAVPEVGNCVLGYDSCELVTQQISDRVTSSSHIHLSISCCISPHRLLQGFSFFILLHYISQFVVCLHHGMEESIGCTLEVSRQISNCLLVEKKKQQLQYCLSITVAKAALNVVKHAVQMKGSDSFVRAILLFALKALLLLALFLTWQPRV